MATAPMTMTAAMPTPTPTPMAVVFVDLPSLDGAEVDCVDDPAEEAPGELVGEAVPDVDVVDTPSVDVAFEEEEAEEVEVVRV